MGRWPTRQDRLIASRNAREKKLKGYLIEIRLALGLHPKSTGNDLIKEVKRLVAENKELKGSQGNQEEE